MRKPAKKPSNNGQYGISLRKSIGNLEFGFTHCSLTPNIQRRRPSRPCCRNLPEHRLIGIVLPPGTELVGASFSIYVGDSTVTGKFSGRRKMPLVSLSPISLTLLQPLRNDPYSYAGATRFTARFPVSTRLGPRPSGTVPISAPRSPLTTS